MFLNRFSLIPYLPVLLIAAFFSLFARHAVAADSTQQWIVVGTFDGADSPSGSFREAVAIDLDSEGNVYIVDRGLNRLLKFSPQGIFKNEIGGYGRGTESFNDPRDVDAHLTLNIFVADYNNNRIVRFDKNLNYLSDFRPDPDSPYYFEMPLSVRVSNQYDMFILEDLNKRVIKFNRFNQPQVAFGNAADNLGQLLSPCQLAISDKNKIFVSDPGQKAVVVFDYLGNFLTEIKNPDFQQPLGISATRLDELVVADPESHSIYFFSDGQSFSGRLNLEEQNIRPVDVSLLHMRGKTDQFLYVLTPHNCLVFKKSGN